MVIFFFVSLLFFSLDWHPNNLLLAAGSSDFKTRYSKLFCFTNKNYHHAPILHDKESFLCVVFMSFEVDLWRKKIISIIIEMRKSKSPFDLISLIVIICSTKRCWHSIVFSVIASNDAMLLF